MKASLIAITAATALVGLAAAPAYSFEGKSVVAPDCDYGGKIKSIVASAEHEVVFTMCKPDPAFPAKAAFTPFGIQPEEHIAATKGTGSILENPIGTGPFKMNKWNRGDSIIMDRNDDYWGNKAPFSKLIVRWSDSGAGRLLELRAGQVDQITNLSPDDFDGVAADSTLKFIPVANPNTLYLAMTNTFKPFDNLKVRQAIALGIDRKRIVDFYFPKGSEVASHFTPCSISNGCAGDAWPAFDAAAAKALLAEAGYPNGFDTKIYFRDVFRGYLPEPKIVAVEFQTQLKENLGINAEVEVMESGKFIDESTTGRLNGFYLLGWGADYPHVTNFLDYHFGEENGQYGTTHPEIYEVLVEASTIGDIDTAAPLYAQANNAISKLVPMVPIAHGASASASTVGVKNSHFRPFGAPLFAHADPGKDTFVFMQNAEPISLYCTDESDGESLSICQQVVEPLLGYAIDSGMVEPRLATGCSANDDGTVWTCALRQGVKFHDGSTFDANDVIASWDAGINAASPNHGGNTGSFTYYTYLWDKLINAK